MWPISLHPTLLTEATLGPGFVLIINSPLQFYHLNIKWKPLIFIFPALQNIQGTEIALEKNYMG